MMGNCFWLYCKKEMYVSSIFCTLFFVSSMLGHVLYVKFSKNGLFAKYIPIDFRNGQSNKLCNYFYR